jgi:protease-4
MDMEKDRDNEKVWGVLDKVLMSSLDEQRRARRWSIFFKSLTFAYLFVALILVYPWDRKAASVTGSKAHTALIKVSGLIADGEPASANAIVTGLRRAFENKNTKAIILAINSPGGTPVQAGYVYDEIKRLRALHEDIKVYAVISDMGTSGAYYIAAAADEIYADKASLLGSIGVISASFGFVGAMEKLGVERRVFTAGDNKSLLDPYQPLPEGQKEFWQGVLGVTHKQFINQVKKGRGDRLKDDPILFSGLIWTGEQSLELGLVDGLGSAGYVARDVIGEENIVDFTLSPHPLDRIIKQLGLSMGASIASQMGINANSTELR